MHARIGGVEPLDWMKMEEEEKIDFQKEFEIYS